MSPEALREANDWLLRAGRDLRAAALALPAVDPLPDIAVYHAQQAAEKALKGFLTAHNQVFAKTHNLERLVEMCRAIEPVFARFVAAAQALNPHAVQFRYPGGPLEPPLAEAEDALALATSIVESVRQRLPVGN